MRNLLYNPSFDMWTYPTSGPNGWTFGGVGTKTIQRESTEVFSSTYSAKVWTGTSTGDYVTLASYVHSAQGINFWKGRQITYGAWLKTDVPDVLNLFLYDGTAASASSYHPGDNAWRFISVTRTIVDSATVIQVYPVFRTVPGSSPMAYFDGQVALEGAWVPQTPYAFEDVWYQLGVNTATAINLLPEEGLEIGKTLVHNSQRAADGHLYQHIFGSYPAIKIPVEFMPASEASIVNSWWENQTKLQLYVTSGTTAVYSCMIMGETSPIQQLNKPYDDRFKGVIELEGY